VLRRILAVGTLALLLNVPVPQTANAQPPTYAMNAATRDPNPRALSAVELAAGQQKAAAFRQSLELVLSARAARGKGAAVMSLSGSVWTDIFMEPQNEPGSANWCGPGSTTAVVTNWNSAPYNYNGTYGTGPIAYMKWLAVEGVPGIGPMVVYPGGNPITYDTTLRDTINNQTSSLFYWIQNPVSGLSNFVAYLNSDLNGFDQQHHPLFTIVWTNGLPGWGTWGTRHYQWVVAFDDAANFVQYGDSAGANSNPYGNPFGWHTSVGLSDYYGHVSNPNAYDEIIW
jgi:hypothetical protein